MPIVQWVSEQPVYAAIIFIGSTLGALAGGPRLVNAIREWVDRTKTRALAQRMSASTGVASFTSEDISHACRNYIEPNCTQTDPSDEDDLRNVVALAPLFRTIDDHFETGGEKRHVILLADSGMGKTSFCINYYEREEKKRKRRAIAVIPLGRGDALEQIKAVADKRNTVCFLDAFDEDPSAVSNQRDRLTQLMNAAADFKNIVVTCRSQFFDNDEDIPRGSGIMYAAPRKAGQSREFPLHRIFLAPFSKKQIDKYLRRHFPYTSIKNWRDRRSAVELVDAIPELSARPMLLELVPDLIKEKRSIEQLFGLYEFLIEKWLKRESEWINERDLLEISIELAVTTFLKQRAGLGDRISPKLLDDLASAHQRPLETWKLKSRSLLNRDIQGQFKFAHRSVMEHLFLLSALRGDERCLTVEWTDLMKDLFVSWGNFNPGDSDKIAKSLFDKNLTATGLFPLASPLKQPHHRSPIECRDALRSEHVSIRHARKIPVEWRNNKLVVKKRASYGKVQAFEIFDSTHGLTWLINDVSKLMDGGERPLYRDPFDSRSNITQARPHSIEANEISKRLPSIEEMRTLWESEPHLQEVHSIGGIFDKSETYWLGDTTDSGPVACSFGDEPFALSYLKPIATRQDSTGRRVHLYEFLGRYGLLNRAAHRAMCAYVAES